MLVILLMVLAQQVVQVIVLFLHQEQVEQQMLLHATGSTFPLTVIARMARKLDQQNVDYK